ncbi:hypothetical protein FF125_09865 [Aureibaculum algae]|uniref:Uncharacterized protein n=1 Tax=Aureibaculum algae TaxID=2584122 RepID=A0A5B7TU10_9FLAO|nr:hypothetical protein [Aureibaculum algae]QCX38724.1 hypothetical protein FF125_09865 [Aureibaculum algae]
MGTTLLRILLSILFIGWIVYGIRITVDTNRKFFNKGDGISQDEWMKKIRKIHLRKVFTGLFAVLIIVLTLIFVNSQLI